MTRDQVIACLHDIAKEAQALDDIEGLDIAIRAYETIRLCINDTQTLPIMTTGETA